MCTITMFGSAIPISQEWYEDSFNLGKKLAERGHKLLYGGGCTGQMGAVSDGWRAGNGYVCGVVPTTHAMEWKEEMSTQNNNTIYTDTLNVRKEILHTNADIQLIFPGGFGTYDEIFSALCRRKLLINTSVIILYNQGGFYTKLIEFINESCEFFKIKDYQKYFKVFNTAEQVLNYIDFITNKGPTN